MDQPYVAVLVPSGETWKAKTAVCISHLRCETERYGVRTSLIDEQCSIISLARNRLVRLTLRLDPKPTHILWVDSDMEFRRDSLLRLLDHDKDIVCSFYNQKSPPFHTIGTLIDTNIDASKGGLHRAAEMPGGFVLVKTSVYEAIGSPWYFETYDPTRAWSGDPDGTVGEDYNFSYKVAEAGFEMWVDLDLTFEMYHIGQISVPCIRPDPNNASPGFKLQRKAA